MKAVHAQTSDCTMLCGARYMDCGPHNWRKVVVTQPRTNTVSTVYYVNSGTYMDTPVAERFREFHRKTNDDGDDTMSFEDAALQYGSLHRVTIIRQPDDEEEQQHDFYRCDCKHFYRTGYLCAHVFLCYCIEKVVNIFEYLNALEPVKGKGRPSKRKKALEKEKAAEVAGSNPKRFKKAIDMIGASVRGVGKYANHRTGFVKTARTLKQQANVVWYTVAFPDAEGGALTVDSMTAEEVVLCYNEQLRFVKLTRSTHV